MTQFHVLAVVVVLAAVGLQLVRPCGVVDWEPMTLAEQAAKAKNVVYGRIIAHYPMPDVPITRAYIAEMDISCLIKGDNLPHRVNISEAGELTSCHHTLLPLDRAFITFLKREEPDSPLVPDEVNYLSVAFEPTDENFKQVAEAVPDLPQRCTELGHPMGEGNNDGHREREGHGEGEGEGDGERHEGGGGASLVSASAASIVISPLMLTILRRMQLI